MTARSAALAKLAKAAALSAQAAKLYAEAAGELEAEDPVEPLAPVPTQKGTEKMRRKLRAMGVGR